MTSIKEIIEGKKALCLEILRSLPEWFGIEQSILDYSKEVESMPMLAVYDDAQPIGFVSLKLHNSSAAEIYVMGLKAKYHRQGLGQKLISKCEAYLKERNYECLTVKTLSPTKVNFAYEKTRLFYQKMGFTALEEFKMLWGEENPCLFMIKPLPKVEGLLHHVELYVSNLTHSQKFWHWFLEDLGYELYQQFDGGVSWKLGDTYIVFVQTEKRHLDIPYHRCRTGLNHLAFHARSKSHIDELTTALRKKGVKILYEDKHPFSGGKDYCAVFFEDPDRIKVELTAT